MSGRLGRAARRLRNRLPASSGHLAGTLRESEARLEHLSDGLDDTNRLLDAINQRVGALAESVERQHAQLAAVDRRLEHTQGLTARAYERQEGWPERLAAIRRDPGYEEAFSGEPLVSVRIGTYRNPGMLCERALASVRRQSYERWEALVVGDACDDETGESVAAIGDPRIKFWNLPFRGPYPEEEESLWRVAGIPPFNAAAAAANGSWIAPLDQDDEWEDDHVETLLSAAREDHAELAYGRMRVALEGSEKRTEFGRWPPRFSDFGFQAALYHAHLKDFRYDPNAWLADEVGDWNLARRMWEAGVRFTFVDRIVGTYFVPADHLHRQGWEERATERPLREA
jgi:uncharacterized coiled-coil protein SlyX